MKSPSTRGRRLVAGLASAVVAFAALTACAAESPAPADGPDDVVIDDLIISVGTANSAHSLLYIAENRGYFAEQNLRVTLKSGASDIQALVSGQADLAYGGTTTAALAATSDKPASVLYATSGGGVTVWTIGRKGIESPQECQRFGTFPKGTSTYAWVNIINTGFKLDAEFVPFTEAPARSAALVAGTIDCANGSASGLAPLVDKGDAVWLVRPDQPATLPDNFLDGVAEVGIIGMKDTVAKKRDAIVRFLSAIKKAAADLKADPPAAVAADLKASPNFGSFDEAALAAAIELEAPVMVPNDGFITEEAWEQTLEWYVASGLDVKADDPRLAFDQVVDMSLYEEAE